MCSTTCARPEGPPAGSSREPARTIVATVTSPELSYGTTITARPLPSTRSSAANGSIFGSPGGFGSFGSSARAGVAARASAAAKARDQAATSKLPPPGGVRLTSVP